MRIRLFAVLVLVALLVMATALPVFAMEDHTCSHDMSTIASLHHCVAHALEMGHITNAGVANSLMAKIYAAQAALDRGQPATAANILGALINEVQAQAGVHIDAMHADHMVMHAQMILGMLDD